jgi:cleavage and polyadenylation specificity factor subunit 4
MSEQRFNFEEYITNVLGLHEEDEVYCMPYPDCPKQHIKLSSAVVCKHWLRGLCKKGIKCEFMHEYNLSRMPECYFFSSYGECMNPECNYIHVDPKSAQKECAWYNRGFCRHGAACKSRHVRKRLCYNYFLGFCYKGPECEYGHPKFNLPHGHEAEVSHRQLRSSST